MAEKAEIGDAGKYLYVEVSAAGRKVEEILSGYGEIRRDGNGYMLPAREGTAGNIYRDLSAGGYGIKAMEARSHGLQKYFLDLIEREDRMEEEAD